MRAWNLLVNDRQMIEEMLLNYRHHVNFAVTAKTVKKVKPGDTVIFHNYHGVYMYAEKIVTSKKIVRKDTGEKAIQLRFM